MNHVLDAAAKVVTGVATTLLCTSMVVFTALAADTIVHPVPILLCLPVH
jgi:hypothetical protein